MKTIYLYIILLAYSFASAQSPVYSLVDDGFGMTAGAYYKDTTNEFNKFVGTWKYQNGNEQLQIVLQKKVMLYSPGFNNYCDILIGEYKYIDASGTETVNTLSNLQINLAPYKNNISGNLIDYNITDGYRKIWLNFEDPLRSYLDLEIILKYIPAAGSNPESIQIRFTGDLQMIPENADPNLRIPEHDYILVKQQ